MAWQQLVFFAAVAAAARREQTRGPLARCPHDGRLLEAGPRGERHCPFGDHTRPPTDDPAQP